MKVEYSVNGWEKIAFYSNNCTYIPSDWLHEHLMKDIARRFYIFGGHKMEWPVEIELFIDDIKIGKYSISFELEPEFTASKIE